MLAEYFTGDTEEVPLKIRGFLLALEGDHFEKMKRVLEGLYAGIPHD